MTIALDKGAFFCLIEDLIDMASPQGKFIQQVLGAAAQFGCMPIREHIKARLVSV